jgi:hypothetical protein
MVTYKLTFAFYTKIVLDLISLFAVFTMFTPEQTGHFSAISILIIAKTL